MGFTENVLIHNLENSEVILQCRCITGLPCWSYLDLALSEVLMGALKALGSIPATHIYISYISKFFLNAASYLQL